MFFIEFEGHLTDPLIREVVAALEENSIMLKPLGFLPQSTYLMVTYLSSVALLGPGSYFWFACASLEGVALNGELIGWGPREPSLALGLELG